MKKRKKKQNKKRKFVDICKALPIIIGCAARAPHSSSIHTISIFMFLLWMAVQFSFEHFAWSVCVPLIFQCCFILHFMLWKNNIQKKKLIASKRYQNRSLIIRFIRTAEAIQPAKPTQYQ